MFPPVRTEDSPYIEELLHGKLTNIFYLITDPKSWSVDGNPIPMAFSDSSMEH